MSSRNRSCSNFEKMSSFLTFPMDPDCLQVPTQKNHHYYYDDVDEDDWSVT